MRPVASFPSLAFTFLMSLMGSSSCRSPHRPRPSALAYRWSVTMPILHPHCTLQDVCRRDIEDRRRGEISVLDPGGFGAVTITKAITLNGDGTLAAILAAGTNGVVVNAGANDTVVLRNLSINGAGTGTNGIRYLAAKVLVVEEITLSGFTQNNIDVALSAPGNLVVKNASITGGSTGVMLNTSAGRLNASLDHVNVQGATVGVDALKGFVSITDSVLTQNTGFGVLADGTRLDLSGALHAESERDGGPGPDRRHRPRFGQRSLGQPHGIRLRRRDDRLGRKQSKGRQCGRRLRLLAERVDHHTVVSLETRSAVSGRLLEFTVHGCLEGPPNATGQSPGRCSGHSTHHANEDAFQSLVYRRGGWAYGGKLTTFRATAKCVMQKVLPVLPGEGPLADIRNITLSPWAPGPSGRKPSIIR